MRDHYDFSNAVKNPFAESMKKGYTIIVEHKDYNEIITVKKDRQDKNSDSYLFEPSKRAIS